MEDIKEELDFSQSVMEGYFQSIWGSLGIDIIAHVNRGVFMVRFYSFESKIKVIEDGVQMFDRKPVVVKPWNPDMDLKKESVDLIPMWIRFIGLDIKYWGQTALTKLAGLVGKPLKADQATTQKERLIYARVLVEVKPHQKYPNTIMFEDEKGRIVEQEEVYKRRERKATNKQELKEPNAVQNQTQVEKKATNVQNKGEQGQMQHESGPISKGNKGTEVVPIANKVATTSRNWKNVVRGKAGEGKQQENIRIGNSFATLGDHQQEKTEEENGKVVENRTKKGKGSEMALGNGQDGGKPSSNGLNRLLEHQGIE
ncbi:PREDICTED: uncharacterized protein LOC109218978 [Nicotiana attenuata]|uniref:uncharacterized protein LOC109218978 n=1 Tax=Nicotiana attenuata TaxID=49451 RepID=UPI000904A8C3|nr:PREDICTED: uncharacterized protein LOC109218978 [Nicotiana attenuata]